MVYHLTKKQFIVAIRVMLVFDLLSMYCLDEVMTVKKES